MRYELKYGCNPNQKPAAISIDGELPIAVLNGRAGYINLLDALNGWQLVRELRTATGTSCGGIVQTRQPGRCGRRPSAERDASQNVFC